MRHIILISMILGLALGCSASDNRKSGSNGAKDASSDSAADADGDADGDLDSGGDGAADKPGCTKMDILFVIDDSSSMDCEQTQLAQAFPGFIQVLENYKTPAGTQVQYRVGVTSTGRTLQYSVAGIPVSEKGMDGTLKQVPGGGRWIDGPGPNVAQQFSQTAKLGTGGPTYEMPLECMREALTKDAAGQVNEGFLRDDSLFILVAITDEDDCSRTDNNFKIGQDQCMLNPSAHNLVPLQDFKDYLDQRFSGNSRYVVVAIAGATTCTSSAVSSSCDPSDPYAGAQQAVRLQDYVANYTNPNSLFSDICTQDMPTALQTALEKMTVACDQFTPIQ